MAVRCIGLGLISAALLALGGCAAQSLSKSGVREALRKAPGIELKKDEVEILDVSETGKNAIVKARITTALRYEQVGGQWVLREIRLGDRRWEDVNVLKSALDQERTERARLMLGQIAGGLERYRQARGQYPNAPTFEALIDQLSPQYLPELIRIDPWSRPFLYQYRSPESYRLLSTGADGKEGTPDDIILQK